MIGGAPWGMVYLVFGLGFAAGTLLAAPITLAAMRRLLLAYVAILVTGLIGLLLTLEPLLVR